MPRDYCPADGFADSIHHVEFAPARRTIKLFDMTSSCNHKCATSMPFMRPAPCLWRTWSVATASNHQHKCQRKSKTHHRHDAFRLRCFHACSVQLRLCTACRNDKAVCACMHSTGDCRSVPRPHLRMCHVSLLTAQSESECCYCCGSSDHIWRTRPHCSSPFKELTSHFSGHNSFHCER